MTEARQPPRRRNAGAAVLERPRSRADAQPLITGAMHRIEQPRHQGQPLALAFVVMIKDVLDTLSPHIRRIPDNQPGLKAARQHVYRDRSVRSSVAALALPTETCAGSTTW
jgi:hypothetical protein